MVEWLGSQPLADVIHNDFLTYSTAHSQLHPKHVTTHHNRFTTGTECEILVNRV